jgi:hydroxyacyl-ACP dehydratase HTD2-like protein with hotdog domain
MSNKWILKISFGRHFLALSLSIEVQDIESQNNWKCQIHMTPPDCPLQGLGAPHRGYVIANLNYGRDVTLPTYKVCINFYFDTHDTHALMSYMQFVDKKGKVASLVGRSLNKKDHCGASTYFLMPK